MASNHSGAGNRPGASDEDPGSTRPSSEQSADWGGIEGSVGGKPTKTKPTEREQAQAAEQSRVADRGSRENISAGGVKGAAGGKPVRAHTPVEAANASPVPPRQKGSGSGSSGIMRNDAGDERRTGAKAAGLSGEDNPRPGGASAGGQRVTGPGAGNENTGSLRGAERPMGGQDLPPESK